MSSKKKRKQKLPLAVKILIFLALILFFIALFFYLALNAQLNKINRVDESDAERIPVSEETFEENYEEGDGESAPSTLDLTPDSVKWAADQNVMKDKDVANILIIGQDRRPGESRQRSDTMIVFSINKKSGRIILSSLMRDTYVQIPGYSDNRLNAAYQFGGMALLDETIEKNFAIHIDGNIEVDFDGFTAAIDTIGGIDIELNEAEAEYMQQQGYSVTSGMNHLDGTTALSYARNRSVGRSDWRRTERQRTVLSAVFTKMKDCDVSTLFALTNDIFPLLTTDMDNTKLMGYVLEILGTGATSAESHQIPAEGTYTPATIRNMEVLVPDLDANRDYLKEHIYG
ncbi:MAG: LCP family protein [Fusicatenibacter sp.]|nr:LCP family protein [Fusicatenibacter sp.]